MPRLNQIRLVNIRLDEGKKLIPDVTWKPEGKNTLFILENGGGKTSFIQLITQTVLPNAVLTKRRLKNTVAKRSTGHILVEWLLDGESPKYLCTGFTFMNGESSQEELLYYNYLFTYNDDAPLTINTMPLVKDGEIMTYHELRRFLQKTEDARVRLPDSNAAYKDELERYQVLAEEWESMRKINGDEGGVAEFFAKAKTTGDLIQRLLIPTIENTIFQSEAEKKEIVQAFKQFKDNLALIPRMKQDLADFALMEKQVDTVINSVQLLEKRKEEQLEALQQLISFRKTMGVYKDKLGYDYDSISTYIQELQNQIKELQWKCDSYDVHTQRVKVRAAKDILEKKGQELARTERAFGEAKQVHLEYQAFFQYKIYKENKQKYEEYSEKIEAAKQSEPELREQLNRTHKLLQNAWSFLLEQKTEQYEEVQEELEILKQEIEKTKGEKRIQEEEQQNIAHQIGTAEANLANYMQDRNKLLAIFTQEQLYAPIHAVKVYEQQLDRLSAEQEEMKQHLTQLDDKIAAKNQEAGELRVQAAELKPAIEKAEEQANSYQNALEKMKTAVAGAGLYVRDLWREKEDLCESLIKSVYKAENERDQVSLKLQEIQRKVRSLSKNDYFIPDEELEILRDALVQKGVFVTLGSEWLADQPISDEQKEQYLSQYPLLPYSILIEEGQVSQVQRVLPSLQCDTYQIPFLFQVKGQLAITNEDVNGKILQYDKGLLVYQPLDAKLFTSRNAIEEMLQKLQTEELQEQQRLFRLKKTIEQYQSVLREVQSFYQVYHEGYYDNQLKRIQSLEQQLKEKEEKISQLVLGEAECKKKVESLSEQLDHIKDAINQNRGWKKSLEDFIERNPNPQELEENLQYLQLRKGQIETVIAELHEELERYDNTKDEIKERLKGKQQILVNHNEEVAKYHLSLNIEADDLYTEEEYGQYKASYIAISGELEKRTASLQELSALQDVHKRNMDVAHEQLEHFKVSFDWLTENYVEVNMKQVRDKEEAVGDRGKSYQDAKDDLHKQKEEVAGVTAALKTLEHRIIASHQKEAYCYATLAEDEYKTFVGKLRESETELIRQRKRVNELEAEVKLVEDILTEYESLNIIGPTDLHVLIEEQVWRSKGKTVKECYRYYKDVWMQRSNDHSDQKNVVDRNFNAYLYNLRTSTNPKVRRFANELEGVFREGKLYMYEYVAERFIQVIEALDAQRKELQRKLEQKEKDLKELIQLAYIRAHSVYENIKEIPKQSRIQLYDMQVQMVKMSWDKVGDESQGIQAMGVYIHELIRQIEQRKNRGATEDEINTFIEQSLQTVHLIEKIAPINNCKIEVMKPRKKSLITMDSDRYYKWDDVASWSGGEEFTSYMTMFMILITHIRKKTHGIDNSWKTIIADNPFGKASSEHVVTPMIQLAEKNKIQLFCLTAITAEDIRKHFSLVTSNRYYNMAGREILDVKHELGNIYYESLT